MASRPEEGVFIILSCKFTIDTQYPTDLLKNIKEAVTKWVKTTDEGKAAWEASSEDFNFGDLCLNAESKSLLDILDQCGVQDFTATSFDAESSDLDHDTVLVNREEL